MGKPSTPISAIILLQLLKLYYVNEQYVFPITTTVFNLPHHPLFGSSSIRGLHIIAAVIFYFAILYGDELRRSTFFIYNIFAILIITDFFISHAPLASIFGISFFILIGLALLLDGVYNERKRLITLLIFGMPVWLETGLIIVETIRAGIPHISDIPAVIFIYGNLVAISNLAAILIVRYIR